jgi:hypothetical protein
VRKRTGLLAALATSLALLALFAVSITATGATPGMQDTGAVTQAVVIRVATDEAPAITLVPPPADQVASALSPVDALSAYQKANPAFQRPSDLEAQLGLYTASPRFAQALAWAYFSSDRCVLPPNPTEGALCSYWLVLDARSGQMLESIVLP